MHNTMSVVPRHSARFPSAHVVTSDKRVSFAPNAPRVSLRNIGSRLAGYLATRPSARWELRSSFSLRATDTNRVAPAPS